MSAPAGYGLLTSMITVLPQLKAQLVAKNITMGGNALDASRIAITLETDAEFVQDPIADSFILLCPTRVMPDQGLVAGGGNYAMGSDAQIEVKFWNRYTPGWTHSDELGLDDASFGILAGCNQMLAALQMFSPLDPQGSGLSILEEPMRCLVWENNKRLPGTEWLILRSVWEAKFLQVGLPTS